MKRRNFLKSILGVASALAASTKALAEFSSSHTTIRKGSPPVDINRLEDNKSVWAMEWNEKNIQEINQEEQPAEFNESRGFDDADNAIPKGNSWQHRGWDIQAQEDGTHFAEKIYLLTRASQTIWLSVDKSIIDKFSGVGEQQVVNREADQFIDEANNYFGGLSYTLGNHIPEDSTRFGITTVKKS